MQSLRRSISVDRNIPSQEEIDLIIHDVPKIIKDVYDKDNSQGKVFSCEISQNSYNIKIYTLIIHDMDFLKDDGYYVEYDFESLELIENACKYLMFLGMTP